MNSRSLKDRLRNVSKDKNVDFNTLLRLYIYDRFIERLSLSDYKDNFILKGGFYLSTLFGVENRKTMDIDTAVVGANFTEENITEMIKKIIAIDLEDNAIINFSNIAPIRNEDEYGGFRISLVVNIDNIREEFHIDLASGDPITPKAITYKYKSLIENKTIKVWAYNIETVIAEKIETILNRSILTSRMRDYYDIYLICSKDWENINKANLRKAVDKTFSKREFNKDIIKEFELIRNSENLKDKWNNYSKKFEYAKNIEFNDVLKQIEMIIDVLEEVSV